MIHRLLYAHGSHYGGGGYRFVGRTPSQPNDLTKQAEVLITRLGYTEQVLEAAAGFFYLVVRPDLRILGRVTTQGTLEYRLFIVTKRDLNDEWPDPVRLLNLFQEDSYWIPNDREHLAPVQTLSLSPNESTHRSPKGWENCEVPWPVIRDHSQQTLTAWLVGLPARERCEATFLIPEMSGSRELSRSFSGAFHLSSPVTPQTHRKPAANSSRKVPRILTVFIALILLSISFIGGFLANEQWPAERPHELADDQERAERTRDRPDLESTVLTPGQMNDLNSFEESIRNFTATLEEFDSLPHIFAARSFSDRHPHANRFENLDHYLDGFSSATRDEDRLANLIFALDELGGLLAVERETAIQTKSLQEKVLAVQSAAASLRIPITPDRQPSSVRPLLNQANELIERLQETLTFLTPDESTESSPAPEETFDRTTDSHP